MTVRYSLTLRHNRLAQVVSAIGTSGKLKVYTGTQPGSVATGATGTLLATLALSATAAPAGSGGAITFNAISNDTNCAASGTPGWATLTTSADARVVDMSAGISGGELSFSAAIVAGGIAACSSLVLTDGSP